MEALEEISDAMNTFYLDGELLYMQGRSLQNVFASLCNEVCGIRRENRYTMDVRYVWKQRESLSRRM